MAYSIWSRSRTYEPVYPLNPAMMVAELAYTISQRLKRFVRFQFASYGMGAFTLPTEIILMIALQLDKTSTISLALTCRRLYSICFSTTRSLDSAKKKTLLILLEQDEPKIYFCPRCVKLHNWHARWNRSIPPWYIEKTMPCKRYLEDSLYLPPLHFMPYYQARLLMYRHFCGPTHGPPINIFDNPNYSYRDSHGSMATLSNHTRIIDDKMLMSTIITTSHPQGDTPSLRHSVEHNTLPVCAHICIGIGPRTVAPAQLPELAASLASEFQLCQGAFGSCPFCLTDYRVDISWQGAKQGYLIKVVVYRELGDCRSPFEWSWRSRLAVRKDEKHRTEISADYGPGFVRDRWNKPDSVTCSSRGGWVNVLGMSAGIPPSR